MIQFGTWDEGACDLTLDGEKFGTATEDAELGLYHVKLGPENTPFSVPARCRDHARVKIALMAFGFILALRSLGNLQSQGRASVRLLPVEGGRPTKRIRGAGYHRRKGTSERV